MANAIPQAEPGIDFPTLLEEVGFVPHTPEQAEYVFSEARYNVPCCGRRWGKSQAAGHRMTYKMFVADSYNWIIGPTYKLGEKEFRVVWRDLETVGILRHCKKSYNPKQGSMSIKTPWNSILEVVSAEKQDSLLGEGLSHAIMSEAAQHHQSTWEQYIEPALSDLIGTCDFPSTPKGFNWYHGLWTLGQGITAATTTSNGATHHNDFKSWQFPTWTNPIRYPGGLQNEIIQSIKARASRVYFDQEYGASFTAITGAIYEEWDPMVHVDHVEYNPALSNYQTFDYGFVNPFVCLDIQIGADETVYVWREYYGKYMSTMEHGQALANRDNPENYHVETRWGDPRGADEAATLGVILGYVGFIDTPWKSSVEFIKRLLKSKKLVIDPSCVNLIREMPQLHVKPISRQSSQDLQEMTGDGNIQHKVDDHCCDALRYFVGPHFVAGAGSHLADVYGEEFAGSESQQFLAGLTNLSDSMILDQDMSLSRSL